MLLMAYMYIKLFLLFSLFLLSPLTTFAHPGGLDSNGGHYCWTNCSYWGEVYGQWHSHGGSSYSTYTSPTTYTAPASYSVPKYNTNSDCPSYGFAYLGECYELPDNAKKSPFTGFTCKSGYEEVGYGLSKQCLPEIDNGYRIGTSVFCDYGYELKYGSCFKSSGSSYGSAYSSSASGYSSSSLYSCPKNSSEDPDDASKCLCNLGYEINGDKDGCKKISKKTNDKLCRADFGKYSLWTGKYDAVEEVPTCKCKSGYEWGDGGQSCVKKKK